MKLRTALLCLALTMAPIAATAPTAAIGMPVAVTDLPISYEGTISALQFIAKTAGGIVNVSFYR